MAAKPLPSQEVLRQLLDYDPEAGVLRWKERPVGMFQPSSYGGKSVRSAEWSAAKWNTRNAGRVAFTADSGRGYRQGAIFGRTHKAHRVIWVLVYGEWPPEEIDHINGDRSDNRLGNLRLATPSQNAWNKGIYSNNTSGFKGVSWDTGTQKWAANIRVNGRQRRIGVFETAEAAHAAYRDEAANLHGEFARTG